MKNIMIKICLAVLFVLTIFAVLVLLIFFSDNLKMNGLSKSAYKNKPTTGATITESTNSADTSLLKTTPAPITANDLKTIVIDGKVYSIPIDMEQLCKDNNHIVQYIKKAENGKYDYRVFLLHDGLITGYINCYSDVLNAEPSQLEFYNANYNSIIIPKTHYQPQVLLAGMSVFDTELEDYVKLTGQEDAEYITSPVSFEDDEGNRTDLILYMYKYADNINEDIFLSGIRYTKKEDMAYYKVAQTVYLLKDTYTLPQEKPSLPPPPAFEELYTEEYINDNFVDTYAYEKNFTLYDFMKYMESKGLDSTFTAPSIFTGIYEFDDNVIRKDDSEYMYFKLGSNAAGGETCTVMVRIGDPVLSGLVTFVTPELQEFIEGE